MQFDYLLLFLSGLLLVPMFHAVCFLVRITRVALHDAYWLFVDGELKDGYGKWNWAWIVPLKFFRSWWKTAWNDLRGFRRVI